MLAPASVHGMEKKAAMALKTAAERRENVGILHRPCQPQRQQTLTPPGQQHWRPQPTGAQEGHRLQQGGMVFLPRKPRSHHDAGNALYKRMRRGIGIRLQADAIGNGMHTVLRKSIPQQRTAHPFRAPHDGIGTAGQPARLHQAPGVVALAGVVLDMHQVPHTRQQPRIAAPKVFAVAMRDQDVRLESSAQRGKRPHRGGMGPARHQLHAQAVRLQRTHSLRQRGSLAAQHQQGIEAARCTVRSNQIHRHLGGTRKSTRHKMQHLGPLAPWQRHDTALSDCAAPLGSCCRPSSAPQTAMFMKR